MFRVRWAKNADIEDCFFTTMSIPEAQPVGANSNVKGITTQNEPWVFAKYVAQCFFITGPTKPSPVVVRRGKRSIIGMAEVADEEDFDQYDDHKEEDDFDEPYTTRRFRTTLPNNVHPFRRLSHNAGIKYTKKRKKISVIVEKIAKR